MIAGFELDGRVGTSQGLFKIYFKFGAVQPEILIGVQKRENVSDDARVGVGLWWFDTPQRLFRGTEKNLWIRFLKICVKKRDALIRFHTSLKMKLTEKFTNDIRWMKLLTPIFYNIFVRTNFIAFLWRCFCFWESKKNSAQRYLYAYDACASISVYLKRAFSASKNWIIKKYTSWI